MRCGTEKKLKAKQRRPVAVARFLNMISLDDRHAATNALLLLGLHAYKQAIAEAPAELHMLRSVVDTLLRNGDDNESRPKTEEMKVNNDEKVNDTCVTCKLHLLGNAKMVLPLHSPLGDVTAPLASSSYGEKFTKVIGVKHEMGSSNSVSATTRLLPKEETPQSKVELAPIDIQGIPNMGYFHSASLSGGCYRCSFSCSCSNSSFGAATTVNKKRSSQYLALDYILNEAFKNVVLPWFRANGAEAMGSSALGSTSAFVENDRSTKQDSMPHNVGESDGDEQRNLADPMVNDSVNSTVVPPSLYGGDQYYSLGFLQQVIRHIEDTRGARENVIVVASSIPQSMAAYTLHTSFADLYLGLLASYHFSFKDDKNTLHNHAQ
ncbi:putative serine/threonine protein kinase, putative,protein kinase [Trypanosoma rangeli]|uniref:Putative serine/threonine protein kinase, putative,protein kinase n=1 Tax=Trypanosoma rangeli TaxID=5698 RepID=A0A3R7KPH4_TRYRA|nr:putative serine/threonine protein kinase, putative,protein kinase [Trypanosoma rangeli]RNF12887.1 putative serine/threonine protein kinase, putative,protein kinase [Trypanosoma rangeli]|eukprot:RNF12887.1 putative serine/threonine protein kinase, putative,protein kinase [Trypanosoma rangeli]